MQILKFLIEKLQTVSKYRSAYVKRYVWPLPKFRREFVVMVDGVQTHGGLADRFRFILSIYAYCKEHNIRFRLHYVYPCQLKKLLLPNEYDWSIDQQEVSYSYYDSEEVCFFVKSYNGHWFSNTNINNNRAHISALDAIRNSKRKRQYHMYGNAYFAKGRFRELFFELFRPTSYLENRIENCRFEFPYEAVTLRFQQLLGDFEEGDFDVLPVENRELLINSCIDKIQELYAQGYFSTSKILVTSDSSTFLSVVQQLDFVCIVPGKMEHMDFTHNDDLEMNSKSFVDLFLLMEARRITLLQTGKMYKSGFPEFAAELGGIPFRLLVW